MGKKDWEQRIVDYSADLMDKHFPKGECKERGKALVFNAKLITYVMGELDKAREEVLIELKDELLEQIEKGRKYEIYGGVADYQDALHLVGNMLSKLTAK